VEQQAGDQTQYIASMLIGDQVVANNINNNITDEINLV
jgi:hypothetical protein